jgi:hypothetical protein
LLRLQTPVIVQQVRVGSRKYQIPIPALLTIQIKKGLKLILASINALKQFTWQYAAVILILEIVWLNKLTHSSKQQEADKHNKLILPLFIFKQEAKAAEDRHLQHYR